MKNPIISVIVPIYNVEKFLLKCLKSIDKQTFKEKEVILINDGSEDSSGRIAKEFALRRNNFFFIDKKNEGLSAARNTGLEVARGEYISFIDSDDFVHPKFLERLYELLKRHKSDISYCNYFLYFPESKLKFSYPFSPIKSVYSAEKALKKLISANTLHSFAWNKLYKKSLFVDNSIKFEHLYFEDIVTIPRLFYFADKIAITSKHLYYYTQRKGSIVRTMDANKIDDFVRSYGSIRNFLQQQEEYEVYEKSMGSYAKKVKLLKNIYIFNLHLKALNFRGIAKNFRNSSKSVKFFLEDDYETTEGVPDVPFPVKTPNKKNKKLNF
ncbi:MAG: glycosyltransferase [Oscillospiraceae bacterium]|jgi:glycosyltransferase involved in cell wall biosynthesis|nr:glycosyltransferase [Oscillospiraceae bacterium]